MKRICFLLALLVVLACGGGGTGDLSGGGGGGGTMSIQARAQVMAKVESFAEDQYKTPMTTAARNAAVATFMKAQPEFSDAKVSADDCVWGKFTDGRYMLVVNNRLPEWFVGPGAPPAVDFRRPSAAPGKVSKSTKARLFHTFGLNFSQQQDPIGSMGQWLTQAGYTVSPSQEGDGRLATLRTVSGDGFFYINTHGGSFDFSSTEKVFCIGSSTLRTDDNEKLPEIATDLDAKRVVYMTAPNGEQTLFGFPDFDTRYAITSKFVDAYWSFGENAVVFINACWSGFTGAANGAGGFIFSCKQKGAGAYLGWTNKIASPASENLPKYFVDRLTAANAQSKESPDQRPFFVTEIVQDMHTKGFVPAGAADLIVSLKVAGTNVGLRPTIEFVQMYEVGDQLYIVGEFGDQPGEVKVDGVSATIIDWQNDTIACRIPKTGAGSFGDVVVKANGKESNARQLTKWTSTLTETINGNGSLQTTINASIKIRQDFAMRRNKPGGNLTLVDPIPLHAAPDSTCSFNSKGVYRDSLGHVIEAWTGAATLALSMTPITTPRAAWIANGAYDPVTGEVAIGFICGGPVIVTGDSPRQDLAGGAATIKILNTTNWTIPGQTETGDTSWTFSTWTPQSPPKADLQYRPRR